MTRARALALAGVLGIAALGSAATATTVLPASTAGYQEVRVTGATMASLSYAVTGTTITGFTATLTGSHLLGSTSLIASASASFNNGPARPCVVGLYNLLSNQTPVTCTGFAQPAGGSFLLTLALS